MPNTKILAALAHAFLATFAPTAQAGALRDRADAAGAAADAAAEGEAPDARLDAIAAKAQRAADAADAEIARATRQLDLFRELADRACAAGDTERLAHFERKIRRSARGLRAAIRAAR